MKNYVFLLAGVISLGLFLAIFVALLSIVNQEDKALSKTLKSANVQYDGVYVNNNSAKWKISGDTAMMGLDEFYPSNNILLGSNIKDGVKYLTFEFADGTGNYTIELWYGKQLVYKDKDYNVNDKSNKFYKK